MRIRPASFLIYLLICLAPLLLLGVLNYWHGVRTVDAAVGADLEERLTAFTGGINGVLNAQEKEIMRLALAPSTQQFLTSHTGGRLAESSIDADQKAASENNAGLPAELSSSMRSILDRRGYFASLALFDRSNEPLLFAERGKHLEDGSADSPVKFDTSVFQRTQPKPDDRVWSVQGSVLLSKPITVAPSGASLQYTAPIFKENKGPASAALVAVLELEPVFSEIAQVLETKPSKETGVSSMVIVLDHSGRILYHSDAAYKYQQARTAIPTFQSIADAMAADQSGTQSFRLPAGQNYLVTFAPLPRLNVAVAVARDSSQLLSSARRTGVWEFVLALAIGVVAALMLELHVQKRSRGMERVSEGLTALAKGELDHRIDLRSSDEARGMADNVNVVTERLRAQIAREAESRQFESFVRLSAMLTHDLKNAIEALSLTVGNMENHFGNEQFRADAMKSLTSATDKLKGLVSRLSKPVTTMSGEHKRPIPTDLVPILNRVVTIMAEPLRERHTIEMKLPPTLMALTDAERIEKVMENLVLNALEAMQEKSGTLTIEAEPADGGKVGFSVSDTGVGMSPQFIEHRLFRPFATVKKNGVGLGLYTCREVVRANAGTIEVQSIEGAGTTFRVMLPSTAIDRRG